MLIDLALVMLAFLLSIPAITGYFAHCYGRSFWKWFAIGCFFPVIAQVILAFLCYKDARKEQQRPSLFISRYEDEQMHQRINEVMIEAARQKDFPK